MRIIHRKQPTTSEKEYYKELYYYINRGYTYEEAKAEIKKNRKNRKKIA